MLKTISKATRNNWQRLHTDASGRLTSRANKMLSTRRIMTTSYAASSVAVQLLKLVNEMPHPVGNVMYSLCRSCLLYHRLWDKPHVRQAFSAFRYHVVDGVNVPEQAWTDESDVLGFVYQSLLTEGERISNGCYYTSLAMVNDMLDDLTLASGETFLDPCCGSGAFLLRVRTANPSNLYGIDNDAVAVMIATTNLLVKYSDVVFTPHIFCADFLSNDFRVSSFTPTLPSPDYIYTNPPWGADKEIAHQACFSDLKTNERASLFLMRSLAIVKPTGRVGFLLPASLLKIDRHLGLRKFIIEHTGIIRLSLYPTRFNGVFTSCFSIVLSPLKAESQRYSLKSDNNSCEVVLTLDDRRCGRIVFMPLSPIDQAIVDKMERHRHDDLSHSQWALGIVTGDNRRRVLSKADHHVEPVITGRDIQPYCISEPSAYLQYEPQAFQQSAPEHLYRAPAKLVYRFIAPYPVVAYDPCQRLCLNSANILIPSVEGLSALSVMALLNSSLYRFYYQLHFPDLKVLQGNLRKLPFPLLKPKEDAWLSNMAEQMTMSGATQDMLNETDAYVCKLFGLSTAETEHILRSVTLTQEKHNFDSRET